MFGYGYDGVSALQDMIDGGGAGQSGPEFEGGGIFSLLANILASPYGSVGQSDAVARAIAAQGAPSAATTAAEELMRPRARPEDLSIAAAPPRGPAGAPVSVTEDTPAPRPAGALMRGQHAAREARAADAFDFYQARSANVFLPEAEKTAIRNFLEGAPATAAEELMTPESPTLPSDPDIDVGRVVPTTALDQYYLRNMMAGEGSQPGLAGMGRLAPVGELPPPPVEQPGRAPGEAASALNLIRTNRVPNSSSIPQLIARVRSRGTPEQIAELERLLARKGL